MFDTNGFGRGIENYRKNTVDPRGRRASYLTLDRMVEEVSRELGTSEAFVRGTLENWEKGRTHIHKDDRRTLVAIIKVLHQFAGEQGVKTAEQANQLLETGRYSALNKKEHEEIFGEGAWKSSLSPPEPSPPPQPVSERLHVLWMRLVLVLLLCILLGLNPSSSLSDIPVIPWHYFEESTWKAGSKYRTISVCWGDVDRDGDLDLAVGNSSRPPYPNEPNLVYQNEKGLLASTPFWKSSLADNDRTNSLAWGDMDNDGDLDLAIGNDGSPNQIYLNDHGNLSATPVWTAPRAQITYSVAWGDVNGDGFLDLAVGNDGRDYVYLNLNGKLSKFPSWDPTDNDKTRSVAWGDMNGDGFLDLAVGNEGAPNKVYLNENGLLSEAPSWEAINIENTKTRSVAWGDMNGDGLLDLAVGNFGTPNQVYVNTRGMLEPLASWTSEERDDTLSIAWGDVDGDGDLDLAVGNDGLERIYLNTWKNLSKAANKTFGYDDQTRSVAWGDMDGDGDLDLALGNFDSYNYVYLNTRGLSPEKLAPEACAVSGQEH